MSKSVSNRRSRTGTRELRATFMQGGLTFQLTAVAAAGVVRARGAEEMHGTGGEEIGQLVDKQEIGGLMLRD